MSESHAEKFQALQDAVVAGDRQTAKAITEKALEAGDDPLEIIESGLVPGMGIVGDRFKKNEVFVPEMLVAARAMKEAMALLEPKLLESGYKPAHTAVIGTVEGDLHDIGKNLVATMLKGANFAVVDLGTNVPPEQFVEAAVEHGAKLIGLSALLTTTMPSMKSTIEAIRATGAQDVRIMIGGAPVTEQFASEIGADGYAPDAASAVDTARELLGAAS